MGLCFFRVALINWVIPRIPIQIDPARQPNRIPCHEPPRRRVVVPVGQQAQTRLGIALMAPLRPKPQESLCAAVLVLDP